MEQARGVQKDKLDPMKQCWHLPRGKRKVLTVGIVCERRPEEDCAIKVALVVASICYCRFLEATHTIALMYVPMNGSAGSPGQSSTNLLE